VPTNTLLAQRGQQNQALGRSRGGFSTNSHSIVDALGNQVHFILTGGEAADCRQAASLLRGRRTDAVLVDKAYDANTIVSFIEELGTEVVISPSLNEKCSASLT
jgi:transposase